MKRVNFKSFGIFLSVLFISFFLNAFSVDVFAANDETDPEVFELTLEGGEVYEPEDPFAETFLTEEDNINVMYDRLIDAINRRETEVDLRDLDIDYTVQTQLDAFFDNNNLYWVSHSRTYLFSTRGSFITHISLNYMPVDEGREVTKRIMSVMDDIQDDWTDLEKAIYIHDYIVTHCKYDQSMSKYGAYDCILGSSVCQGYASAYALLCNKAGLECHVVSSDALNHAWNLVKIDGNYYYVDCTFDDPIYNGSYHARGWVEHDDFIKSREGIHEGYHVPKDWGCEEFKDGDTRYDDFFWKDTSAPIAPLGNGRLLSVLKQGVVVVYTPGKGVVQTDQLRSFDEVHDGFWEHWFSNSGVAYKNGEVFVSDYDTIYEVDEKTGKVKPIYTLNNSEKNKGYIFGIVFEGSKLRYDIQTDPCDTYYVTSGYLDLSKYVGETHEYTDEEIFTVSRYSKAQEKQVRAFVERLYTIILGRKAEAGGVNDWSNRLLTGQENGAEVARGFIESEEFTNQKVSNDVYVKKLYKAFFDREADAGGYNGWMSALSAGHSRYEVLRGFTNSEEFGNLCAKYGITIGELPERDDASAPAPSQNAAASTLLKIDSSGVNRSDVQKYVDRIYSKVLNRAADGDGLNYWVESIMNGTSPDGIEYDPATVIRTGFFTSQEYKNLNRSTDEFITDVYLAFFDRSPDADGFAYWQNALASGEYDRDSMITIGFGHSTEFKNLLQSYGFKVYE